MRRLLRPARPDDLAAIVQVYADWDLANRGFVDSDEGDVRRDWDTPGFDREARTRVLEVDGTVVGYAVASAHLDADSVTRPGVGGDDELLAWLEGLGEVLQHHLPADDAEGTARMTRRGWVADRTYWRMRIELDAPVPEPAWPRGFESVPMEIDRFAPTAHALIEEAFLDVGDGHVPKDLATWSAAALAPDRYDPELYRVVVRDGEVVAAIVCHQLEAMGYVRQLAVAKPARGNGLGLALLHEAFRACAARGLPAVELGVDAANATGATRLYERAGMHVNEAFTRWAWQPPAGRS